MLIFEEQRNQDGKPRPDHYFEEEPCCGDNWHLSKPEDFDDSFEIYKRPPADVEGVYNNGTLIMLDSDMIPFLEVTFWEMLPRRLSGFTLESDVNDIQYTNRDIGFCYRVKLI